MTTYAIPGTLVIDANGDPVPYAVGHYYAQADTALAAPLAITDLAGVSMPAVTAGPTGMLPDALSPEAIVVWVSGTNRMVLWSPDAITAAVTEAQADALASRQAAQVSATAASTSAAAAVAAGGAGGIAGSPSIWPDTFPPAQHTTQVADLRRSAGVTLASSVAALLAATSDAEARTAIGAGTGSGTSNLKLGTSSADAMPATRMFKSDEISLVAGISGMSAATVQAALVELAARGAGGSGTATAGTVVAIDYAFASSSWPLRSTIPSTAIALWRGPAVPPVGGGYSVVGDQFLKKSS